MNNKSNVCFTLYIRKDNDNGGGPTIAVENLDDLNSNYDDITSLGGSPRSQQNGSAIDN